MAEAVGLAASVLGLAQTAWTVAKGLYDLADEIGSAGDAVRVFANDFWLFVETTKVLGDLLDSLPAASRRTESTTEELLDVAMDQVVKPFETLLRELEPLLVRWRDSPSRMRQLGLRIQWAFSCKSKILFYHAALNALKGNMSLLLQALSLQAPNPPHVHLSIADTKTTLQGTSRNKAPVLVSGNEAKGDGRLLVSNPAQVQVSQSGVVAPTIPRPTSRSQDSLQLSTDLAVVLVTDADEVADSLSEFTLLDADSTGSAEQEQEEREEQLEAYAAIRAVQKKVIRLADEATTAASASSPYQRRDLLESSESGSIEDDSLSKQSTRTSVQSSPAIMQHRQKGNEHEQPPEQPREPVAAREAPNTRDLIQVIYFTDTLGSSFEIPYNLVRTWQVSAPAVVPFSGYLLNFVEAMHAFIAADYDEVNWTDLSVSVDLKFGESDFKTMLAEMKKATRLGQLTVVFAEDRNAPPTTMVLAHEWDTLVKPGWNVELRLDTTYLHRFRRSKDLRNPSLKIIRLATTAAIEAAASGGHVQVGRHGSQEQVHPLLANTALGDLQQRKTQRSSFAAFRDRLVDMKRA
ncbi:hypothetical protein A1O7_08775 [Cladophialophora yegresii CBS 114405]|uniref:Fungal N-terminal domain-containing protein n=1 Tax=Cladophialophora yegresii CBS 114405 TaxID=1182544 RepID=W9WBF1_9EURO|nr:uncharacterized protein A1O7_08775 [Cladophialophora yegresii CBS 114405]EXJ55844.1 hypothetical protein A1O7_08775 [Cladophialophora yegresii CBS 114405]